MKKFLKVVAVIMLCCISFLCVGCYGHDNVTTAPGPGDNITTNPGGPDKPNGGGSGSSDANDKDDNDDEDLDDDELEGVGDDAVIGMYGTKVLYRPNSYDYDAGSGGNGEKNNYYGVYAYYLLNYLYYFYGISNLDEMSKTIDGTEGGDYYAFLQQRMDEDIDVARSTFFYDSNRYMPNAYATITKEKKPNKNITEENPEPYITTVLSDNQRYNIVGADSTSRWNWSFSYKTSVIDYDGLKTPINKEIYGNKDINLYIDSNNFEDLLQMVYDDEDYMSFYTSIFLGTDSQDEEEKYSDFVKTLEYVVYSYAMNMEPQMVTVRINDTNPTFDPDFDPVANPEGRMHNLYDIYIGAYESVDEALNDITDLFHQTGSHVGLMDTQIRKIANWIKANVIGLGTTINNDDFTIYKGATAVYDEDGNLENIEFDLSQEHNTVELGRNYDEVVDKIVEYVCQFATIGKDPSTGDDVTIDDKFLASEIMEYAGESFFIDGDENFPKAPKPGEEVSAKAILPLEYQSVVIMLNEPTALSDVVLALKYDADLDGTKEGVYDMNKYIDIIVELNYYSHRANRLITIGSERTRVYDGPYEFGVGSGEFPEYNLPDDHGTVWFSIDANNPDYKDLLIDVENDTDVLPVGAFNPDIGGGILKTDVGHNNYLKPYVSKNPIVLVGTTDVRKYYSIIEPDDEEIDDPSLTYTTGRLNPDMFAGSDGCDYLEITYKVLKKKGDRKTNYKFYTGIVGVFNSDQNVGDDDDEW